MNTKLSPPPYRRRLKRAARKLAKAERRAGAPSTLQQRQAAQAYSAIRARLAELPLIEPPEGWEDRAHERAVREGVLA